MAAKWRSLTCGTSAACKCVGAAGGAATSGRSPSFQRALERLRRPQAPQLLTPWRDDIEGAPRAAEARLEAGVPLKARRSPIVRRASRCEHGGSYPAGDPEKERRAPAPRRAVPAASSGYSYWLGRSDARTSCVRASKNLCSLSLLRDCSARLRPAAAGSRRVGGRSGSQPSLHLPSTCARGPFAARLDARATEELRSDSQVGPARARAATNRTTNRWR